MRKVFRWSVAARLLVAFLVSALLPLGIYFVASSRQTTAALQKFEHERITARVPALTSLLHDRAVDQIRSANDFAPWRPAVMATQRGDSRWLQSNVIDWLLRSRQASLAQIISPTGSVIAAGGELRTARLWQLPEAQAALMGAPQYGFEPIGDTIYLVTAVPIRSSTASLPRGVLLQASPLTAETLRTLAGQVAADSLTLFRGDQRLASFNPAAARGLPAPTTDLVSSTERGASSPNGNALLENADTIAVDLPLRNSDGRVQAELRVAMARGASTAASSALGNTGYLALLAALAAAAVIALAVSISFRRRLSNLAWAAERIASGEIAQHLDVKRDDEIGRVAVAFNEMSDRLQSDFLALTQRVESLSSELANLNIFGETLSQSADVPTELDRLAAMLTGMFHSDFAAVFAADGPADTAVAKLVAFAGAPGATSRAAQELGEWAIEERNPITVAAATVDERLSVTARLTAEGARSLMAVPLIQRDKVLGALCVGSSQTGAFEREDLVLLGTVGNQIAVALDNAETYRKLETAYLDTVKALAAAMEAKDHYTADHAETLATMAVVVGRRMGLSEAELRRVEYAAILHDVGKIGVPGSILNKPGKLTQAEFSVMAEHTIIGERIISRINYLKPVARVIRSAHERWDGGGYPDRIAGEQIPLESRIVFVCDAFHAMTSDRPYRKALPVDEALEELRRNAGQQFDPQVVKAFLESRDELLREVGNRERVEQAALN